MAAGNVAARSATACSSRWSNSSRELASRDSTGQRGQQGNKASKHKDSKGKDSRALRPGQAGGQSGQSGQASGAVASNRQSAPRTGSNPASRLPTVASRRRSRRSTGCARPTTTCGAPPRGMPARPIPAARPTVCARRRDLLGRPPTAGCRQPLELHGADCRPIGRPAEAAGR